MKTLSIITLLAGLTLLSGCASKYMAKHNSTGAIGCLADEITIDNEKLDIFGYTSWVATCKGKQYVCRHHDGEGTNCHEKQ